MMSLLATHRFRVIPEDIPNHGILFVDHEKTGRSGHGGNCLTQCKNGDIISFNSNVDGDVYRGHGVGGWSEYRISRDLGKTWGDPIVLDYSRQVWEGDQYFSALIVSLITAPNGTLVAVAARFKNERWVKQAPPVYLLSHDHGRTWGSPKEMDANATLYDLALTFDAAFVFEDTVYVMFFGDIIDMDLGVYSLYASEDNGETFTRRSVLPFDPANYYSTAGVLDDGSFVAYSYPAKGEQTDEHNIPYVISSDQGHTWSEVKTTYFAQRIRNPQMSAKIGDLYFLHGRSGSYGPNRGNFVLYSSTDGINWDEGTLLYRGSKGTDCYSGNAAVRSPGSHGPDKLLIQSSIGYDDTARVNTRQWWIERIDS